MIGRRSGQVLFIDAGSTRLKWAVRDGLILVNQGVLIHGREIARTVAEIPGLSGMARILVASVLDAPLAKVLAGALRERFGVIPEFAVSAEKCCGVINGYDDPGQLGVDRWLAVVAGWNRWKRSCVVVDCGTAVTLDLVDEGGHHQGGQIVPGIGLMADSLRTATRLREGRSTPDGQWGRDTSTCIAAGIHYAVAALVDRMALTPGGPAEAARGVLMTGGDAPLVAPLLKVPVELLPDLVLDGLALWAGLQISR